MTIQGPNYTQIPNVILDNLQGLKGAEVKVIMAICRNTFGYHRTTNRFSLSYLQKITGLSRQGVVNSTKKLVEIDWLNRHSASLKGGQGWEYEINLEVSG